MKYVLWVLGGLLTTALIGMTNDGHLKEVPSASLNWFLGLIIVLFVLADLLHVLGRIAKATEKLADEGDDE